VVASNQSGIAAASLNQPDTPIVFLSYAREDQGFVLRLTEALRLKDIEVRGDWQLVRGESYEAQLQDLQLSADTLLFVLSSDSLHSAPCRAELERADEQGKRILPVVCRDAGPLESELPKALSLPQWTFMRPSDDFITGVQELVEAINTDFDLMPEHRRLLQAAEIWQRNGRNASYLLRKDGLKRTEYWLTKTSVNATKLPKPTALQLEYIHASQSAQMRGSRMLVMVISFIAVAMTGLAIVALVQRQQARKEQRIAEQRLQLAATRHLIGGSRDMLHVQPDTALLLAAQAVAASRPLAEAERRSARDVLWDAMANVRSVEYFLYGLDGEATGLGVNQTGRGLFAADLGGIVQWDLSSRSLVGNRLIGPKGPLFSFWKVVLSPDGKTFYVAIAGTGVLALDAKSGELLKAFNLADSEGVAPFSVRAIAMSEDGRWLAVGTCMAKGPRTPDCGAATILLIDLRTGSVAKRMSLKADTHVTGVAFRPGLTEIAVALEDGTIEVFDYSLGRVAYKRALTCEHEAGILAFSPDGQLLASGCSEGRILLWVPGEAAFREIKLSADPTALAFDPSGSSVAVGAKDGSIQIVNTKTCTAVRHLKSLRGAINALTFGPDRMLFSATKAGEVSAWNLASKDQFSTDLPLHTAPVVAAAVNAQNNLIAAVTKWGEVAVWQLDGRDIRETQVAPSEPTESGGVAGMKGVAISPNGERVAVSDCSRVEDLLCSQGRIRIWNLGGEAETPSKVLEHPGDVEAMLFLNEDRLVSAGAHGSLLIWDLGSPSKPVLQAHVTDQRVSSIAKSSDSTTLIVGSYDGEISFWNVPDLTEKRSRLKMDKPIRAIAPAAQSSRFAVTEANGTTLWDLIGNEYRATKLTSIGSSFLYLSADGTEVFSGIGSGKVALWLSGSQRPYRELLLDASIGGAVYSPMRKWIVTWGDSVVIWNLDEDAWSPIVSQKANRALRPEEEDRYLDLKLSPTQ
jgi:WD40 repeat protein